MLGRRGSQRTGLPPSPAPIHTWPEYKPSHNPHRHRHLHGHQPVQIPRAVDRVRVRHACARERRAARPAAHGLANHVEE
ncbi:hydrolase, N-terminal amidase [Histoplasma ohiense]|nr:hydrolase, N-terminal amidase [Histoplasma ohiense (nom. inval.)]